MSEPYVVNVAIFFLKCGAAVPKGHVGECVDQFCWGLVALTHKSVHPLHIVPHPVRLLCEGVLCLGNLLDMVIEDNE